MSPLHHRPALRITKRQYKQFKQSVSRNKDDKASNDAAYYQQMFERNRAVKLVIDPETGQIVDANEAACNFYGYSHEQFKSLHIGDINTLSASEVGNKVQKTVNEKGANFQFQHRLASGEIRDVEIFSALIEVNDKQYVYEIIQDITARLQAEKALRESDELHRLLTTQMPNSGVIMFDLEMRYTLAEGPFLKQFGVVFENIVGKLPHETLPTESLEFLVPIYKRALNGESFNYERITDIFAYESFVAPIRDDNNQIIGGIILSHDITERKRLENALRANEERLQLIMDNIQDLVTYDDVKGNFVYVSPSSRQMLGYAAESLLNESSMDIIHPDDRVPMTETLGSAMVTGSPQFTVEGRLRHADGHYINIETVGKLLSDGGSNFTGGVFITRDVTQRKQLQELELEREKLKTALEKEQEFSILKTRMMQRINHEFRTPLTIIQAATETITNYLDRLTPEQIATKEIAIKNQIRRLTNMLDEIQILVQESFRPNPIHRFPADISVLCRKVAFDLENELNLLNKFVLDVPDMIVANVDVTTFEKAIYHILHNAARFSAASDVVNVSLALFKQGIEIRVVDGGFGILPHEQHRIFEPFYSGSNARNSSGLGIGLSVARAAIEAHGGTISLMSSVGNGTSVTIWLPM